MKHHANAAAHLHRINVGGVEILPFVNHPPRQAAAWDQVVHAVEGPQHGAFAAAGGADERGDLAAGNAEERLFDGLKGAVADRVTSSQLIAT